MCDGREVLSLWVVRLPVPVPVGSNVLPGSQGTLGLGSRSAGWPLVGLAYEGTAASFVGGGL